MHQHGIQTNTIQRFECVLTWGEDAQTGGYPVGVLFEPWQKGGL